MAADGTPHEKIPVMSPRLDPWLIWPRAFSVGVLAFTFGVVGHVSADGMLPGAATLVVLLSMSVLLSVPMLARPAGRVRLMAMLVGGQTVTHLVLSVTAGHRGDLPAPTAHPVAPAGPQALPVVDGHRVGSLQDVYQNMSGEHAQLAPTLPVGHLLSDLSAHAPMMAAHLTAAALLGLWLARGERLLWSVLALTGRCVLAAAWALAPTTYVAPAAPGHPIGQLRAVPVSRRQARPGTRRGPPVLACC